MLFKLAFRNVRRQIGDYLIYFITVSLTVAFIFSINNMIFSDVIRLAADEIGSYFEEGLKSVLFLLSGFLSVVIAFVLGYATSFLLSRRKKEFGLYLTMGMTRGNIVLLFAGETAFTFLLSLGMGVLLGAFVFQAIVAIFSDFLLMEYAFNDYSLPGTLITVIMVCIIFLLSSVFSMLYLGNAKISRLLQGEKLVEKTVKRPATWFFVALVGLALLIVSVTGICVLLYGENVGGNAPLICGMGALCAVSIVLFYLGLTKCVIPLLLKRKKFSSRGTNTFTLRLISGRLSANSFMTGVMAVLLSVVIIGSNIFLSQVTAHVEGNRQSNPYDLSITYNTYTDVEGVLDEFISEMENYGEVEEYCHYYIYETDEITLHPLIKPMFADNDRFMKESDYRKLCGMLGREAKDLNGGFLILPRDVSTYWDDLSSADFSNVQLTLNGTVYSCTGVIEVQENLSGFNSGFVVAVVPDAAISQNLTVAQNKLVVNFGLFGFDRKGLFDLFIGNPDFSADGIENFYIKEGIPSFVLSTGAPIFLIILFVSAVFALLSMAVLALKSLSMISEDKERYRILWRVGANEKTVGKTLFSQLFFFFLLPFGVPILLNIPLGFISSGMAMLLGVRLPAVTVLAELAGISGGLLALYALYFTATYLLAWLDVKKALRSAG